MEKIDESIKSVLKKLGLWKKIQEESIVEKFNEEYPPKFDYNIEATELRKGILVIEVKHPALMSNLMMMKPALLKDLRKRFSSEIKDIKFRRMKGRKR